MIKSWPVPYYSIKSWSVPHYSPEEIVNNLRFPGQYYDAETGLHYNWHRYYDPETGRYISPDPIGLRGGINLYSYVQNDPVNWVDPEGLTPFAIPAYEVIKWGGTALIAAMGAKAAKETADAINDASSEECHDPCQNDPNTDKCLRLAEKITNLRKEVYEKRIPDLENNPGNLPERIGPGEKLRDTVRGHRKLLNRQWRRLQELEDRYEKECRKKC